MDIILTKNGDNLLIEYNKFPLRMDWYEAKLACEALGQGWRLPTIEELEEISENLHDNLNLHNKKFWSSTEDTFHFDYDCVKSLIFDEEYNIYDRKTVDNRYKKILTPPKFLYGEVLAVRQLGEFFKLKNGRTVEIAEFDFTDKMNWYEAKQACKALGNDWRLPTIDDAIQINKKYYEYGWGNFKRGHIYWSSSQLLDNENYNDISPVTAGGFQFENFEPYNNMDFNYNYNFNKLDKYYVRAVRESGTFLIDNPITGRKLEVAEFDFLNRMEWADAKYICENLGDDWRLPTIEELELISRELFVDNYNFNLVGNYWKNGEINFAHHNTIWSCAEICNFKIGTSYWSSSESNDFSKASTVYFRYGKNYDCVGDAIGAKGITNESDKWMMNYVRAVRGI